ncbi:T-cell receptor beta chain T17T-22 [Tupaia chinensis]|nr:T-cell receptor beta chain T17T-22 [Tupaia chinensis]
MRFRLLCCVALYLLRSGLAASEVTQMPKHLIKARGQQGTLRCSPVSGHTSVYWYQQVSDQGPQFLIQYYNEEEGEKGNIPDRFSARQFSNYSSELNLSSLTVGDSALYLCASSLAQPCLVVSLLCKNDPAPLRKWP